MALSGRTNFEIKLSDEGLNCLKKLIENNENDVPDDIKQIIKDKTASIDRIKSLHNYFKSGLRLHELLCTSDILLPQPIYEPRNPELEARIQKLKKMSEQRQYDSMTKNVRAKGRDPDESVGAQLQFMNKQLIAVAQFIFSVGSGFAFGFYGVELIVGDLDFGFRLLLGVICSLIIALAEIYFLAKIIAELDLEGIVKTEDDEDSKKGKNFQRRSSESYSDNGKVHQD